MKNFLFPTLVVCALGLGIIAQSHYAFFDTHVSAQTIPTLAVTVDGVTVFDTSATVRGKVQGSGLTGAAIEYSSDNSALPAVQSIDIAADGTFAVTLVGLEPLTKYYYQFHAYDALAGITQSLKYNFVTKSPIFNFDVTNITTVKATIEGKVVSSNNPDVEVRWGGSDGKFSEQSFKPAIKSDLTFSEDLTNLLPDTEYEVMLVRASNPNQQVTGIRSFHTFAINASAYAAQVSDTAATIFATPTEGAQSLSVVYGTAVGSLTQTAVMQKGTDTLYSAKLTGLKPFTTYIYAIRVTGPGGTKDTSAYSFSTSATPANAGTVKTITDTIGGNTIIGTPSTFKGGLVPCSGVETDQNGNAVATCGFKDIITLIGKIIQFCLVVVAPLILTALALYGGILLLTQGSSEESRTKAKGLFKRAFIGLLISLGAWLIVKSLLLGVGYDSTLFPTFFK